MKCWRILSEDAETKVVVNLVGITLFRIILIFS